MPDEKYPIGIPIEVCDLFLKLALDIKERRWRRYSADAILHQIRWHYHMERHEVAFKANNNWTSGLARWAMKKDETLLGFFELREKTGKASEWIDADN